MKKRMLALILCLVFCFSLMGVAMASEEVEDEEAEEEVVVVEAEAPEEDGAAEDEVVVEGGIVTYADYTDSQDMGSNGPNGSTDIDVSAYIGDGSIVSVTISGSDVDYTFDGTYVTVANNAGLFPNGGTVVITFSSGDTLSVTVAADTNQPSDAGSGSPPDAGSGGGAVSSGVDAMYVLEDGSVQIGVLGLMSVDTVTIDGTEVSPASTGTYGDTGPSQVYYVIIDADTAASLGLTDGSTHTVEFVGTSPTSSDSSTTVSGSVTAAAGEGYGAGDDEEDKENGADEVSVSLSPAVWQGGEEGVTVTVTGIEISSVLVNQEDCGADVSEDNLTAVIPADYLAGLADGKYEVVILGGSTPTDPVTLEILTPSPEVTLDAEDGVYEHVEGEGLTVTVTGLVSDVVLTVEGIEVGTVLEESEDEYVIVISADELDEIVAGLTSATITVTGIDAKGNERSVSADLKISGEWDNEITGDLDPAEAEWEFGQDEDGLTFALDLDKYTVYITDSNGITNIVEVEVGEGSFTIPASYLDTLDGNYTLKAIEILPEDAEEDAEAAVLGATLTIVGMEIAEINGCGVDDELTINWTEGDLEITVSGMEVSEIVLGDTTLVEGEDYVIEDGIITISSDVLEGLTGVNTISFSGLDVLGNEVTISGNLVVGGDSSSSSSSGSDDSSSGGSGNGDVPSAPPSSGSTGDDSGSDANDDSTGDDSGSDADDDSTGEGSGGTGDGGDSGSSTGNIDPGFSQGDNTEGGTAGGPSDETQSGGSNENEDGAGGASAESGSDSSYGGYGSSAGDSSSSPQTGDTNTFGIWCAVILLCGAALIGTAVLLKKRENG